jgi:hypothetical protein
MFELEMAIKALALIGMLALVLVAVYAWTQRKVVARFWCEAKEKFVVVRFISSPFHRRYIDVESCSAFREGDRVDCEKECLEYPKGKMEPASHQG